MPVVFRAACSPSGNCPRFYRRRSSAKIARIMGGNLQKPPETDSLANYSASAVRKGDGRSRSLALEMRSKSWHLQCRQGSKPRPGLIVAVRQCIQSLPIYEQIGSRGSKRSREIPAKGKEIVAEWTSELRPQKILERKEGNAAKRRFANLSGCAAIVERHFK